jgi:hypothetical protein
MAVKRNSARRRDGASGAEERTERARSSTTPGAAAAADSDTNIAARSRAASEPGPDRDVAPWLRCLGLCADDVRRLSAICEATMPDAPINSRVRFALRRHGARFGRKVSFAPASWESSGGSVTEAELQI